MSDTPITAPQHRSSRRVNRQFREDFFQSFEAEFLESCRNETALDDEATFRLAERVAGRVAKRFQREKRMISLDQLRADRGDDFPDPRRSPPEEVEIALDFAFAIDSLDGRSAQIFVLRCNGHTAAEIADMLGVSRATVHLDYGRALIRLQRIFLPSG